MRRKLVHIIAALLVPLCFASCLKETNNDKTIVLFGEEGYVKGFKQVVGIEPEFFNNNHLLSVTIDDSYSAPPDIRGEYLLASRIKTYPEGGFLGPNDTVYFRFGGDFEAWEDYLHGQHHFITHCDILIPGLDLNSAVYHTDTTYVRGEGNSFFAYLDRKIDVSTSYDDKTLLYTLRQGIVIAGRTSMVDADHYNILDARLALYNRDVQIKNGWDFPAEVLEPIYGIKGTLYVFKDSDGVTEVNRSEQPYINWNE